MATKYDIQIVSPAGEFASTAVRARKDAAVKFGDSLGETYRVVTDSGKVVHEVTIEEPQDAAPAEETVEEDLIGEPQPEAADEPEQAEEPAGPTAEEEVAADEVANARVGSEKFDIAKMKDKIAKMLAKAERTDNEHERETFTAAAERMMLRLGIQAAELEAAGEVKAEEIVEVNHTWTGIYATTMVEFTHRLAQGFGNLTILQSSRGQRRRVVFVIGHKSDVEQFMALLASLNLQAVSGLKRFQKENTEDRAWRSVQEKFVQDRSFLQGFAGEVSRRLSALRVETEAEATTGAALVLASKMDRVTEKVNEMYPNMGKARGGMQQFSSKGAAAGRTAGQSANIGGKSVSGGAKGALKG
jgi:hypothetical protein